MKPTLLLTSSAPDARWSGDGPAGPRTDYDEIASVLDAEIVHPAPRAGPAARMASKILRGGNWPHAWRMRRARANIIVSLSEQIGLPLSFLASRSVKHVLVAHNVTTERRRAFQRRTGYLHRFDRIVVLSRPQERYLREEAGIPPERVQFVYDKVDHRFFSPAHGDGAHDGYVLSIGREQRDYGTLVDACVEVAAPTIIVPSSLWNPADSIADRALPANVTLRDQLSFPALRDLYSRAAVVAVPLRPQVDYAAGVNAVLEAMAMGKPLVVTSTPGLEGYAVNARDARVVPPADPGALAEVIGELLADREEAQRLAANARSVVANGRNLDSYVRAIADIVREVAA